MKLDAPGLENDHVSLRPGREEDAEAIFAAGGEQDWAHLPDAGTGSGFKARLMSALDEMRNGSRIGFSVCDARNGTLVGLAGYTNVSRTHRRLQIDPVWIGAKFRGKNYFVSSQLLLLQRAFDWGARRVSWQVNADLDAAMAALEAFGAVREGTLRSARRLADGSWSDVAILSLLRSEWPKAKSQLMMAAEA